MFSLSRHQIVEKYNFTPIHRRLYPLMPERLAYLSLYIKLPNFWSFKT